MFYPLGKENQKNLMGGCHSPPPPLYVRGLNFHSLDQNFTGIYPDISNSPLTRFPSEIEITVVLKGNLVPRAFPLKKWVGREKVLASDGHVSPRIP